MNPIRNATSSTQPIFSPWRCSIAPTNTDACKSVSALPGLFVASRKPGLTCGAGTLRRLRESYRAKRVRQPHKRCTTSTMVSALVRMVATALRIPAQLVFSSPGGTSGTTTRAPGCGVALRGSTEPLGCTT